MEIGCKSAIILCNGEPPYKFQLESALLYSDLFIAADGGGNTALDFNIMPDLIIGDLDSFSNQTGSSFTVIKIADQNSNDLEKALTHAKNANITSVTVFGATGRRVDHTVKNLSVMKRFNHQFNQLLYRDKFCDIKLITSPHTETLPVETSVSLFPLSGRVTGINTNGLKYKLINGTLENGVLDGSSNETIKPSVEITFESGDLLLFINHSKN